MDSRLRRWNPTAKLKGCRRDQERSSLWELVKTFVHRGMEGVVCELVDETGSIRSGMCHIDVRLGSELVLRTMLGHGQSMSSRSVQTSTAQGSVCGTMSGSERPVASLSREKAGCEEWAALSEELADLQASPDEEIRRLTGLFRTGCRPLTLKRQPNLEERSSVSNVKTSQTRHLEEDTEQFLRTKIESMEVAFADRCEEKSNLEERLDALSERRGCEGTRRLD